MTAAAVLPNVEERLAAAAFQILTDDNRHDHRARRWAVRFLRRATHGRRTEFQDAFRMHRRGGNA